MLAVFKNALQNGIVCKRKPRHFQVLEVNGLPDKNRKIPGTRPGACLPDKNRKIPGTRPGARLPDKNREMQARKANTEITNKSYRESISGYTVYISG